MSINVGDAVLKITGDTGGLDKSLDGIKGKMGGFGSVMKGVGIGMLAVGTAAIGAGVASVKSFMEAGDEIQKMALRTGFSTESLSELKYMADLSGTSLGGLEAGIKKMQRTIIEAQDGTETYTQAFDKLGIEYQSLMGLSPEEQFNTITTALAEIEDPTLKAALSMDIFGRSGTDMLPILAEGAEGIAKMKAEAADLGVVFSQEAADSAAEFNDSLTRVQTALQGVMNEVAVALMPALTPLADALKDIVKELPMEEIGELIGSLLPPLVELILEIIKAIPMDVLIKLVTTVLRPVLEIMQALLPILEPILFIVGKLLGILTPVLDILGRVLSFIFKILGSGIMSILSGITSIFGGGGAAKFEIPSFQFGGIVPGPIGAPKLVMAHGGEPIGYGAGAGGGVNNNFNISQLVVREDADVSRIARELYRMQRTAGRQAGV